MNELYYGDCLTVMRDMKSESVDLIYLDPPFNSARDYNAIYKDETTGKPLPEQVKAFDDTWHMDIERDRAIHDIPVMMRKAGLDDDAAQFWASWANALRNSQPALLAYISYMTERLLVMKKLLKPTGSIYLHCDPTASHYIKIMMDTIFGSKNFRREIIWNLETASGYKSQINGYIRGHDTILYYTMGDNFVFNKEYRAHKGEYISRFRKTDDDGRKYRDDRSGGRRQYLDETKGVALTDVWSDIMSFQQNSTSKEILGYATQKPVALLERIIKASSNEGDVVLDPFCGCATTLEAAHRLGRKWIGADIAFHAVKRVSKVRLEERLGLQEGRDFIIRGIPRSFEEALDLWKRDTYHFQEWVVAQVGGFVTAQRASDGGIDGRLYFVPNEAERASSMVIEVKGGQNVGIGDVRNLRGTLERDSKRNGALIAGLIVLHPLGDVKARNFREEMASAGDWEVDGKRYAKMQLLTVDEILEGKRFETPGRVIGQSEGAPRLPMG